MPKIKYLDPEERGVVTPLLRSRLEGAFSQDWHHSALKFQDWASWRLRKCLIKAMNQEKLTSQIGQDVHAESRRPKWSGPRECMAAPSTPSLASHQINFKILPSLRISKRIKMHLQSVGENLLITLQELFRHKWECFAYEISDYQNKNNSKRSFGSQMMSGHQKCGHKKRLMHTICVRADRTPSLKAQRSK